ncbi:MAG: hypothetical protein RR555_09795 [Bacteroidales bacterium]
METTNSQRRIGEAIRKMALERSIERANMSQCGADGVGAARMIHGYVANSFIKNLKNKTDVA